MKSYICLLTLLSASTLAQNTNHTYVGGDFIYSDLNLDPSGGWDFDNSQSFGFSVLGGYNFYQKQKLSLSVEAQYYSFGKFDIIDKPYFVKQGTSTSKGYFINFNSKYYFSKKLALEAGLALGLANSEVELGSTLSDKSDAIKFTLGASYDVLDDLAIVGGLSNTRFDFSNILTIRNELLSISAGVRYRL
ncbi:outer membrane beta-barrel protein [Vibrio splendidus]|uniref:outer membrane beta-barrel protein n=1 Tax=Vibrio splendidus TaxID=29497 RepID=UPI00076A6621|nr:outer membrane beta-barrel protein [Vibrio splendidus]